MVVLLLITGQVEDIIGIHYLEKIITTPQLYRIQKLFKLSLIEHMQWAKCHFKSFIYPVTVSPYSTSLKLTFLYSFLQMKSQSSKEVKLYMHIDIGSKC